MPKLNQLQKVRGKSRLPSIDDPIPVGSQLLAAAGVRDVENYSLFAILPNGEFEDIRLDETFDLRAKGAETFAYFESDRSFNFTIENRQMSWGKNLISGKALRNLAGVDARYSIYLEVRGGHDRLIEDHDLVDLASNGIERFITVISETTEGLEALPSAERRFLEAHGLAYETINDGGIGAVVIKDFTLPLPWIKLNATNSYAACADVPQLFAGASWQRWSRHAEWRPGIDGIRTMVTRAQMAFEKAK